MAWAPGKSNFEPSHNSLDQVQKKMNDNLCFLFFHISSSSSRRLQRFPFRLLWVRCVVLRFYGHPWLIIFVMESFLYSRTEWVMWTISLRLRYHVSQQWCVRNRSSGANRFLLPEGTMTDDLLGSGDGTGLNGNRWACGRVDAWHNFPGTL